ncbi:unnamed protein product [Urochloa decumbens]|uniref:PB1 domain-containing protein n=1 Tax=Urochloa decumbens TaxID=240449 RepID=A0ABC8X2I1_9POAL
MAGAEASSCSGGGAHIRLNCSHGGVFLPCGPDGAPRYVGGETRVLAVPRAATFRDLAARLSSEVAGGAEVRAIRHRLADDDEGPLGDVLVSVTCDEELAHMRDEYDRLRATRPDARFRVFVITSASNGGEFQGRGAAAAGLPPLAPKMRRIQSDLAQLHLRPAPMRRIQSAEEIARATARVQPAFPQCNCQRRGLLRAPAPPPARPMYYAVPCICMSKKVAAPLVSTAKATRRVLFTGAAREKARSRYAQAAMENRRTIWESVRA